MAVEAGGSVEARVGVAGVDVVLALGTRVARRTLAAVLVHTVYASTTVEARAVNTGT